MRRTWSGGFTLVELLVVIAIISVLAALLLPTLESARDAALGIECASRLKQIGTASVMYEDDFNGYIAPWSDRNTAGQWWNVLLPYLEENKRMFICPASREAGWDDISNMFYSQTLGINGFAFYHDPIKRDSLRNVHTLIYSADGTGRREEYYDPYNGNGGRWMGPNVYPDHGSSLYPRHGGGSTINILFVAGHVSTHPADEVRLWAAEAGTEDPAHFRRQP